MPMPRWWRHINKRVFNPRALNGSKWDVLTHTGRSSGKTYQTPMEVIPVENGFVVFLVYGAESDWVLNMLASGSGTLRTDGREVEVTNPRVVDISEVTDQLPADAARPPGFLKVNQLLRMDEVETV